MRKIRLWRAGCIFCFLTSQLYIFSLAYDWTSTHNPQGFLPVSAIIVLLGPALVILASMFLYRLSYDFEAKRNESKDK